MSAVQNKIIQLCQQISEKGLTPSLALIKSHSTEPLPMQAIIKVLQQWKHNPQALLSSTAKNSKTDTAQEKQSLEQRVQQLEQQVAALTAMLNKMQQN